MSDLEITKLCAEAMSYSTLYSNWNVDNGLYLRDVSCHEEFWNPLHNDAQAMALVKKFRIGIAGNIEGVSIRWFTGIVDEASGESINLNRAICECVAKMQKEKPLASSS